jgi:hypothetical protein
MSAAASAPFSETKAPESRIDCTRALRLIDISASTMANIGPAYGPALGDGSARSWPTSNQSRVIRTEPT